MYQYECVRVAVTLTRTGGVAPETYEPLIHSRAQEGWRLVQIFIENPASIPSEYVLIFEKSHGEKNPESL